jgi:acyl carrier protein
MSDADYRIKKVMAAVLGLSEEAITEETVPENVSSWDSLNHVHLIMALEAEFGLAFEPEQALGLTSVAAIRRAVSS